MSALDEAIAAWRKTKHPRFASLAKWALHRERPREPLSDETWHAVFSANDPLDVPRLIDAIANGSPAPGTIHRLRLLEDRADPNVVSAIIELLDVLPEPLRETTNVFRACVRLLQQSKDPRARAGLETARDRFATLLFGVTSHELTALAQGVLSKWADSGLDESMNDVAARLEASFADELARENTAHASRASKRATDEALLAAIYASPDDDAPRLVFADVLTERGDARGEFISLQLARARGPVGDEAVLRERALRCKRAVAAAWGLPLSAGGHVELQRGFPWWLELEERTLTTIVGHPALRLVERLRGLDARMSPSVERALLNCDELRGARQVRDISSRQLAKLDRDRGWQSVALLDAGFTAADLAHLPELRALELPISSSPPGENPLLQLEHLERLSLTISGAVPLSAWLDDLDGLEMLTLRTSEKVMGIEALRRLPKLRGLQLQTPEEPQLEGLNLESLTLTNGDPAELSRQLPSLTALHLVEPRSSQRVPAFLRQRSSLQAITLGNVELERPFTAEGVARITASAGLHVEGVRDFLISALQALSSEHVQRIEVLPRRTERFLVEDEASMSALEQLVRENAHVPVIRRWQ